MQYIAEKINEGNAYKTIEVDSFCGLRKFNNEGNRKKKILIEMLIINVIISPAETFE